MPLTHVRVDVRKRLLQLYEEREAVLHRATDVLERAAAHVGSLHDAAKVTGDERRGLLWTLLLELFHQVFDVELHARLL